MCSFHIFSFLVYYKMLGLEEMKSNVDKLNEIQTQLDAARDELDGINKEEELLEWEPSQFPILSVMYQLKQPYDQLWNTALEFHTQSEIWMNGEYATHIFIYCLKLFFWPGKIV